MKPSSYKHTYPRTLLADVLMCLMHRRRFALGELAKASGINRGTIHGVLNAQRSCDPVMRQRLLGALDPGNAAQINNALNGDSETILSIPDKIRSVVAGDIRNPINTLCKHWNSDDGSGDGSDTPMAGYSLGEIYRDAMAMEQSGKWLVACRCASHVVSAARRKGDLSAELNARLFHSRMLMASSQFGASQRALKSLFDHPAINTASLTDPTGATTTVYANALVYQGWLAYEMGCYENAICALDTAIARLTATSKRPESSRNQMNRQEDWCLEDLLRLKQSAPHPRPRYHYHSPLELLNLALHTRAKVLAERAIYIPTFRESDTLAAATKALLKSVPVTCYLGRRGMLGHELVWLARVIAVWRVHVAVDEFEKSLRFLDHDLEILAAADKALSESARCAILAAKLTPFSVLAAAADSCFDHFQSQASSRDRGYYFRAKGAASALDGDYRRAEDCFADACDLLSADYPDARGLGPLLFERHLLQTYRGDYSECTGDIAWLLAAAAVHPSRFIAEALRIRLLNRTINSRPPQIQSVTDRILTFQKPFMFLRPLGAALWGRNTGSMMEGNIKLSMSRALPASQSYATRK